MKSERLEELRAIGARIKEVRKLLRLSQKDMAEGLGITSNHLSEIESGKTNPTAVLFLNLASVYNANIGYLFHGTGDPLLSGSSATVSEFSLDAHVESTEKLLWLMNQSPYVKHYVLGYASRLVIENEEFIRKSIENAKKQEEKKQ
jgi:transcriptional regulator with XRE-family HTH domain